MLDKNTPQDASSVGDDNTQEWPDAESAHLLMQRVLEHYKKHHLVVTKKLGHARKATVQSLQDIESIYKDLRLDRDTQEFREVKKYDRIWDEIIEAFSSSGVTETELEQIEHILTTIPDTIRRYYEALVMQDRILQDLIKEMNSEVYLKAIEATRKIQARRNLMTGLGPEIYEPLVIPQDSATDQEVIVYKNVFPRDRTN
ncbi:MAG: hypothetical protein HYU57_05930 [Micavibrio aeruginosavorus]|nr:hypothetical protein [Micavibrio aeruginosavorus]